VAAALQHAVRLGQQREHVAGAAEILRPGVLLHTLQGGDRPSAAEMPVVVETWSMETVKGGFMVVGVVGDHLGNCSFWMYAADMGMQMSPLAWLAMKLTFSVVANWAAQMRSPSFSRPGRR
jgi:hypothetical protein